MAISPDPNHRTGGQLIVEMLCAHGVETVFGVPGESYLPVLDALYDTPSITMVSCRHESGAGFMAEAHGKLTGQPGVALVTRGPGACNASIAVHTAFQDSTPMLLLVGQIARGDTDREAFQEIDYRQMFGSVAKWVAQVDQTVRVPEYLHRAFHVAMNGRPGPVVLALPEDMLSETIEVPSECIRPVARKVQTVPESAEMARLSEHLRVAERPLLMVGGSGWTDEAAKDITHFAETWNLPVCTSFRRQDIVSNDRAIYGGDLGTGADVRLLEYVRTSDLLVVCGARLGEITTQGYSLLDSPLPRNRLIHIHPSAEELGRVYSPDIAIQATMGPVAKTLAELSPSPGDWSDWTASIRRAYLETLEPSLLQTALDPGHVILALREILPRDVIVTLDAGNFSGWPQRFLNYGRPGRQLGSTSGSMGYSVPAAVAAKLARPGRTVVSFVGDGGVLMTGQELATAMRYNAPIVIILVNNGMYGTIRMHQEKHYPARVSGTDLTNPSFADWARSFGAFAERVERTEEFLPAFERARNAGRPAVLELIQDPEIINSRTTISALRKKALQHQSA
ncbi:thiamine pyrophosphate-binding protein [Fodinicurvata sediminis]|uniref:thiamine pyrophosphate-binding protein n=1 Tax=Fodinicurvata sediminis TaxID=1121832 RepID=UPI0003B745B2|nr:thiamine pyrophosphate-binding protein [Fodinicurvata sediminis]